MGIGTETVEVGPIVRPAQVPTGALGNPTVEAPTVVRREKETRWFILPSLMIVAIAGGLVAWGYSMAPVPPGADTAHWMTVARAFYGLPYPKADFTLTPGGYPPLVFPILGAVLLATGSPVTTGFIFGGLLLVGFGLSVIHLSRRFLLTGPFQILFVGLAILNGTTLQILFWGGYPNFLGLILFNEALVFLLAFARSRSWKDALLCYGMIALVYLSHDLTFAILLATVLATGLFLLLQDRRWGRLYVSWQNLAGVALVCATVGGFVVVTTALNLSHPGYLFANPGAYRLDNVGELFHPLFYAPWWLPSGPGIYLDPTLMLVFLFGLAGLILVATPLVRQHNASWVPPRLTIALAAVTAAITVPAAGYLIHVDTDYARFVFFFPIPLALAGSIIFERGLRSFLEPAPAAPLGPVARADGTRSLNHSAGRPSSAPLRKGVATVVVVTLLLSIAFGVDISTVQQSELTYAGAVHTNDFLSAMTWLKNAGPVSENVLADSTDTQRWVQLLTGRDAYTPGLTYLDFYAQQVMDDELSYLAWNGHYAVTNNQVILSLSGGGNSSMNSNDSALRSWYQAPLYSAVVDGITFPLLRIPTSSIEVQGSDNGKAFTDGSALNWTLTNVSSNTATASPSLTAHYLSPNFWFNETCTAGPGNSAGIGLQITPFPGVRVSAVNFSLQQPSQAPMEHWYPVDPVALTSNLTWVVPVHLGQIPTPYSVATSVTMSDTTGMLYSPVRAIASGPTIGNLYQVTSLNASTGHPFVENISLTTPGTGNPAVQLTGYYDTNHLLTQQFNIHFLVLPNLRNNERITIPYFESEFGFHAMTFGGWTVLWR